MRIVIVEDSGLMARILALLIERSGSCVAGRARVAAEALPVIHACHPDAVTVDLSLEGGGSLELIERVSALDIPVIVVSAATYAGSPATAEALRHGASACVDKAGLGQCDALAEALAALSPRCASL